MVGMMRRDSKAVAGGSIGMTEEALKPSFEFLKTVAIVVAGLLVFPIVVVLYCIPSIRLAFDLLAYEDAMRG